MGGLPGSRPTGWRECYEAVARAELRRLQETPLYLLAVSVLDRPAALAEAVRHLLRPPAPWIYTLLPPAPERRPRRDWRGEIAGWKVLDALRARSSFRFYEHLLALKRAPFELPRRLPEIWRLLSGSPRPSSSQPPASHPPEHFRQPAAVPAAAPRTHCQGPAWLEEMLGYEGMEAGLSGVRPGHRVLICAEANAESPEGLRRRLSQARATGAQLALWVVEGEARRTARLRVVAQRLGVRNAVLPPSIQPRLHNPIGYWSGQPELGVQGSLEGELPDSWRKLVRQARGQSAGNGAGHRQSDRLRLPLLRRAQQEATLARRWEAAADELGLPPLQSPPLVSVLLCTCRPARLQSVVDAYRIQSYPHKELTLVLNASGFDLGRVEATLARAGVTARIVPLDPSLSLGACLQIGCEASRGQYLCRMDDDDFYGRHYIADLVSALSFSEAGVVGKSRYFLYATQTDRLYKCQGSADYCYTNWLLGGALMLRREVLGHVGWRDLGVDEDKAFHRDCMRRGIPLLATDPYNFAYRRGDPSAHTYQRGLRAILRDQCGRLLPDSWSLERLEL